MYLTKQAILKGRNRQIQAILSRYDGLLQVICWSNPQKVLERDFLLIWSPFTSYLINPCIRHFCNYFKMVGNIYKPFLTILNMRKKVKRYGKSLVISFSREEKEIIGLTEGDIIDFEIKDIETRQPYKKGVKHDSN